MISYVGVGARANQDYQTAGQPALPAGIAAGDLLLCQSLARSTADNVLTSSWPTLSIADTAGFYVLASYRIATGADTVPTITPGGMSSGQTHVSRVTAWRGVDTIQPFGPVSTAVQTGSSADVANILIDLAQRETMNRSAGFAGGVVDEVGRETPLLGNTHRFAGFAVLKAPDVPSVLIELGYLSNDAEERNLRQPEYRTKLAKGISRAVDRFFLQGQKAARRP